MLYQDSASEGTSPVENRKPADKNRIHQLRISQKHQCRNHPKDRAYARQSAGHQAD